MSIEIFGDFAAPQATKATANYADLTFLTTEGRIKISAEFAEKLGFALNNSKAAADAKYLSVETNYQALIKLVESHDGKVKAKLDSIKKANPTWSNDQVVEEFVKAHTLLNVVVKGANDFPEGGATGKVSLSNGEFSSAASYKTVRAILGIPRDANVKISFNSEKVGNRHVFQLFKATVEEVERRAKSTKE